MSFGSPNMLWLLLVLPPALTVFFWFSLKKRERLMQQFIQARLLPNLTSGISAGRRKCKLGLLVLAVACLIVALARPQWGFSWQEVKQRGVDMVVAIDVSKSMLTQDIAPNRLARAKLAALELMQKARTDRLGLVAFAGSAFLACPLTIDDAAFSQSVESLNVNSVSEGGTAIADAIEAALPAFKEEDNQKVLVLMTDGEDHDSGAIEAAQKAAAAGLKIYTIGVGTPKGDLIRLTDAQGKSDYVRDEQGNVVRSHLDEDLLRRIAGASDGGFYLPLQGAKTISTLYDDPVHGLGGLRKTEHQEKLVKQFHQRYHWPLTISIVFLIAEILIPERRREFAGRAAMPPSRRPDGGTSPARPQASRRDRGVAALPSKVAAALIVICLLSVAAQAAFAASPSQAFRDYKEGKYDQALRQYEQLLKKGDDPRLHFNAGASAYRNQQYDQALKQFEEASSSPDLKLQELSYYNRANSLFLLGEQNPDQKKRVEQWEQALKDYDLSLKLNPQDSDAKFNQEFVKKKLEELKQQQQQNQQSNQDKNNQQQDQKDQSQQNNQQQQQNQDKQSQQNQSQQQQNQQQQQQQQSQAQDKQQQQQQQQNQQQQGQQEQQQQKQQSDSAQNQKQQQQAAQGNDEKKEGDKQQEQIAAAQQMSQKQAEQLLDAQKGKEKVLSLSPQQTKAIDPKRKLKDW